MSDDILDFEADELEEFIQKYMQLDREVQQQDGIFSILPGSREKQYQNTLKNFLNPPVFEGFQHRI